jgi:glycosyltransferase involved in cell wall biosynthesis
MDLSVVIPARDVAATLREQLDALLAQDWARDWEVVVVDNGSTDATPEIVADYDRASNGKVRLVRALDGSGVNYVRNAGIEAARSHNVAICDGDDIVAPRWVAAMGEGLQQHPVVTGPIEVRRLNPEWLVRTRGDYPLDAIRTYHGLFPIATGGNIGIRRGVWSAVGRFREDIFGAVDDLEFCLRLYRAGIPIHFDRDAMLHYRYRSEPAVLFRQGRFYGRGKPLIGKLLQDAGLPRPSRIAGWRSWVTLVLWLPRLASDHGRAAWCWVAGNRLGQIEGCVRHRALYL